MRPYLSVLLLVLAACASRDAFSLPDGPPGVQAVSLLGDSLTPAPASDSVRAAQWLQLDSAHRAVRRAPDDFLQIMVYAGAIMVLFLFVIMLLSLTDAELGVPRWTAMKWLGAAGALGLLAVVWSAVRQAGQGPMRQVAEEFGTVKAVGRLLFTQYLLTFEAASVLLLVAIVGAVVVAKQRI